MVMKKQTLSERQKAKKTRFIKPELKRAIDSYFKKNPEALKAASAVLDNAVETKNAQGLGLNESMQYIFSAIEEHVKSNLSEVLFFNSPRAYMEHYSSFPGYTNMVVDFGQVVQMMRLKKAERESLKRMIDNEKMSRVDYEFYRRVFIKRFNENDGLRDVFNKFFTIYFRHATYYIMQIAIDFITNVEPKLSEELYKVPLYFDQFFRDGEATETNVSIPEQGISEATAIVLKKPKGANVGAPARRLIATDLFTAQRIKGGLSERHVTIIEAACSLYEKKIRHGEKAGFTIGELADLIGKNKHSGGGMYQKMVVDFTDIYNMRFHDGEGFIRLFVETKILGKANHVLLFDGENQSELLERCIFHIAPEALDAIADDKMFFFQSSEYFRLEPFMKFISRKICSTVTRNRNFQTGGEIKECLRLSLGTLTDDSGIGFDYSQPKRELKKLVDMFMRAEKKGILKDFFLTIKTEAQHIPVDTKSTAFYKQISKNRDNIFFNFSPSDDLKWTLKGGLVGQLSAF